MNALKKAALHLHGLEPADCQWVLDRLPERQQGILTAMLDELQELGIPRDPNVLTELNKERNLNQLRDHRETGLEPTAMPVIARAPISNLVETLKGESEATIAAILLAGDWPWKTDFLSGLDFDRQEKIAQAMEVLKGKMKDKFRISILNVLAERLAESSASVRTNDAAFADPGKFVRLWRFFRRRICLL